MLGPDRIVHQLGGVGELGEAFGGPDETGEGVLVGGHEHEPYRVGCAAGPAVPRYPSRTMGVSSGPVTDRCRDHVPPTSG